MKEIYQNIFSGGMDTDTEARLIDRSDWRDALNLRSYINRSGELAVPTSIKGTSSVEYVQPAGTNVCLGAFEDKENKRIFEFWSNSNQDDHIIIYDGDTRFLLAQTSVFNWVANENITDVWLIDNLLYWNDSNKLRKMDIQKASFMNNFGSLSPKVWNIYWTRNFNLAVTITFNNGQQSVGNTFSPSLYDWDGVAAWINATSGGDLSATTCTINGSTYIIVRSVFNNGNLTNVSGTDGYAVAQNFYSVITDEVIDLGKYPAQYNPTGSYQYNPDVKTNYVQTKVWQFATRIWFDNYEHSVLSSYSPIIYDTRSCDPQSTTNSNYIQVDFTDPRFKDPDRLQIIDRVEILAREGNTGQWKIVGTLYQYELMKFSGNKNFQYFDFYNDGNYTVVDSFTADKQYDTIPLRADTAIYMTNRAMAANIIEGYNPPICKEAQFTVNYDQSIIPTSLWTIVVREKLYMAVNSIGGGMFVNGVYNLDSDQTQYPVYGGIGGAGGYVNEVGTQYRQFAPEGGHPHYLVGTDHWAYGSQITPSGIATTTYLDSNPVFVSNSASDRTQIRDYVNSGGEYYSEARITNVKGGQWYVYRVASPWVSKGDKLSFGNEFYNIDNPNGRWQETSAYTLQVGGQLNSDSTGNLYRGTECSFFLSDDGTFVIAPDGTQYNVSTPFVLDMHAQTGFGDTIILDLTDSSINGTLVSNGYLFDADAQGSNEAIATKGVTMELQVFQTNATNNAKYVALNGSFVNTQSTDANGFWFWALNEAAIDFKAIFITSSPATAFIHDEFDTKWTGGLTELYDQTLTNLDASFNSNSSAVQYIVYNTSTVIHQTYRTRAEGTILNQDGNPVSGINVVLGFAKSTVSQSTGQFAIVAWVNAIKNINDRLTSIFLSNISTCQIDFDNGSKFPVNITQYIISADYSIDHPYVLDDIVVIETFFSGKFFKRGGRYKFALRAKDSLTRSTTMIPLGTLSIPYFTENGNGGLATVSWNIPNNISFTSGSFESVQWCRTKNLENQYPYLQWLVNEVLYVTSWNDTTQEPEETTFAAGNAKEIYLSLQNINTYKNQNSNSLIGYEFTEGDRLRLIADNTGTITTFFDFPIHARRFNADNNYVIIEYNNSIPELTEGWRIEIYPLKLKDEIEEYYEMGESIAIVNNVLSITSGDFVTGDTYAVPRIIQTISATYNQSFESAAPSDFMSATDNSDTGTLLVAQDIGRVGIVDDADRQITRPTAVRFSGTYQPNSKINDLSTWNGLDIKEYDTRQYGGIHKLIAVPDSENRDVLLAYQETRVLSIYVGTALLSQLTGTDVVTVSDTILGSVRVLAGDYGTTNRESVTAQDGLVIAWDNKRLKWHRYGRNGIIPITDNKCRTLFEEFGEATKAISTFDRNNNEWITTLIFLSREESKSLTVSYSEMKDRWMCRYSFVPEQYCRFGDSVVSFKDETLWVHEANELYNNFYGVQYTSQITATFGFMDIQMMYALRIKTNNKDWSAPSIETPVRAGYPNGQLSRIKKNRWKAIEGDLYSEILNDVLDPMFIDPQSALFNGRKLRSDVLNVTLENDSTSSIFIRGLTLICVPSMYTIK